MEQSQIQLVSEPYFLAPGFVAGLSFTYSGTLSFCGCTALLCSEFLLLFRNTYTNNLYMVACLRECFT